METKYEFGMHHGQIILMWDLEFMVPLNLPNSLVLDIDIELEDPLILVFS